MEFKNQMEDVIVEAHKDKQKSKIQSNIDSFFKGALESALKQLSTRNIDIVLIFAGTIDMLDLVP
jgi:hypothetical protein